MHVQMRRLHFLYKRNLCETRRRCYWDYQYIQRSKIPTMHFQASLPRLPIPKLELTCERYLAAQKPLLIDEAYRKTEANVNHFKDNVGKHLQKLLRDFDKQNKHTSYISEFWFDNYLRDRKPIPINYNPMLVMNNDEREQYNTQLIRAANLVISSLRFYKSLHSNWLEPEVYHLDPQKSDTEMFRNICAMLPQSLSWYGAYLFKAYPLDMSQYPNLFNSTRIPETDIDRLVKGKGRHITVQHKGHIYAFTALSKENQILPPEQILARLKYILEDDIPKNTFPIGVLTTLERNKWATVRHELAENGNQATLKLIDTALFNICLDDEYVNDDPYAIIRNFLHSDGENRWFDKSFSLQVSKDGVAAVNFEHSWGDGVAVLRYLQDIYKDSIENPVIHSETRPYDEDINNIIRLDMNLSDRLKVHIEDAKREYRLFYSSLDFDYLIMDRLGKNLCKKQAVSPDAIVQLGIQVAYHKMQGKFVPTYESCSTAAFKHGRTETVRSCTMATKAFTLAINAQQKPPLNELKMMIAECSRTHSQLTREAAMGQGFDRHLYVLKKFAEKTNMTCNIFDDPDYAYLNRIILSTSTLTSPVIYAGGFGPVVRDGLGVGYTIKDDQLRILVTCYPPYHSASKGIDALRQSFEELTAILDTN
ncbi:carnitine O-palmitoyltransferase 2, mitochondrial [Cylas formicarius]|uniref:carnitine O-palmitoyltransferase 2, mitochondrial n=1 Tax=Cylas formicarius TaxID=197179 RepID=UPI002958D134|nr:carnitine O-palmitoyltransferase 2, mitochondrial [Cylas formicarius]